MKAALAAVVVAGLAVYGASRGPAAPLAGAQPAVGVTQPPATAALTGPVVASYAAAAVQAADGLAVAQAACTGRGTGYYDCTLLVGSPPAVAAVTVDCLNAAAVSECTWWPRG